MKHHNLFLISLALLFAGCSTGKKALERGDYDKAVLQAVNRLQSDPDNEKALKILPQAYKLAVATHLRQVKQVKASPEPFRAERAVQHYQQLNNLHNEIQRCPACLKRIPQPQYFFSEFQEARKNAAEARYQAGDQLLSDSPTREQAKQAYQNFLRADSWIVGYKDVNTRMDEALWLATLHVVIEPTPAPMGILQLDQAFFNSKLDEYLHRANINPYVRFYSPAEAKQLEWVDHRISMQFGQFALGNIISNTYEKEVSRDSVKLNTRGPKDIYGTVRATYIEREKALVGRGVMEFQIEDLRNNRVITRERFPSEYRWESIWATYRGDERALTKEQLAMTRRRELAIPPPQLVFEEFAYPLFDQAVAKISSFYRHY